MKTTLGILAATLAVTLVSIVVAAELLTSPTPEYTILETYQCGERVCFVVEGYACPSWNQTNECFSSLKGPASIPSFNSTEFVSDKDVQSLLNFHARMDGIKEANAMNAERQSIGNRACLSDKDCLGVKIGQEYACWKGICQRVNATQTEWADSLNLTGSTI
jgi:hypothetical protein